MKMYRFLACVSLALLAVSTSALEIKIEGTDAADCYVKEILQKMLMETERTTEYVEETGDYALVSYEIKEVPVEGGPVLLADPLHRGLRGTERELQKCYSDLETCMQHAAGWYCTLVCGHSRRSMTDMLSLSASVEPIDAVKLEGSITSSLETILADTGCPASTVTVTVIE